jgi:hypothetical protein
MKTPMEITMVGITTIRKNKKKDEEKKLSMEKNLS